MDIAGAINVLVLTIHAHTGATTSRNMRTRSRIIDFNFRTTNPR
jgi:hypothetical protein